MPDAIIRGRMRLTPLLSSAKKMRITTIALYGLSRLVNPGPLGLGGPDKPELPGFGNPVLFSFSDIVQKICFAIHPF
jgi:hypothetical protein